MLTTQMPLHLAFLKKIRGFLQPPCSVSFFLMIASPQEMHEVVQVIRNVVHKHIPM